MRQCSCQWRDWFMFFWTEIHTQRLFSLCDSVCHPHTVVDHAMAHHKIHENFIERRSESKSRSPSCTTCNATEYAEDDQNNLIRLTYSTPYPCVRVKVITSHQFHCGHSNSPNQSMLSISPKKNNENWKKIFWFINFQPLINCIFNLIASETADWNRQLARNEYRLTSPTCSKCDRIMARF